MTISTKGAVFIALASIAVIGMVFAIRDYDRGETESAVAISRSKAAEPVVRPPASMSAVPATPTFLAITDSISLVSNGAEPGRQWPDIVAERMGWQAQVDAVSGRGFLASNIANVPQTIAPFGDGLAAVTARVPRADHIVIDGGENDFPKSPDAAIAAMHTFVDDVREAYPRAKVYLMAPAFVFKADLPPGDAAVHARWSGAMESAAARIGNAWVIDALVEGWYRNVDPAPFVSPDKVHLNARGQEFYADQLVDSIERLGVADTVPERMAAPRR